MEWTSKEAFLKRIKEEGLEKCKNCGHWVKFLHKDKEETRLKTCSDCGDTREFLRAGCTFEMRPDGVYRKNIGEKEYRKVSLKRVKGGLVYN